MKCPFFCSQHKSISSKSIAHTITIQDVIRPVRQCSAKKIVFMSENFYFPNLRFQNDSNSYKSNQTKQDINPCSNRFVGKPSHQENASNKERYINASNPQISFWQSDNNVFFCQTFYYFFAVASVNIRKHNAKNNWNYCGNDYSNYNLHFAHHS